MTDHPIRPEDVPGHAAIVEAQLETALGALLDMKRVTADEVYALIGRWPTDVKVNLLRDFLARETDRDGDQDTRRVADLRGLFDARNTIAHWIYTGFDVDSQRFTGLKRYRGRSEEVSYSFEQVTNLTGKAVGLTEWLGQIVERYAP